MTEMVCPSCGCEQGAGLLCARETDLLEKALGDVRWIVTELGVTLSKQARMGAAGKGGLARERNPMDLGAMQASVALNNVLTTWARDVSDSAGWVWVADKATPSVQSAAALLVLIDHVRRHRAVEELMDEITDAINQARHAVDRSANRTIILVGPCPEPDEHGRPCLGEVYAFIPTEDDRPSRMQCKYDGDHKWGSTQWLRAGKRIADLAEELRRAS